MIYTIRVDIARVVIYAIGGFICGGLIGVAGWILLPLDVSLSPYSFWGFPSAGGLLGSIVGVLLARRGPLVASNSPSLSQKWSGQKVLVYVVVFGSIGLLVSFL